MKSLSFRLLSVVILLTFVLSVNDVPVQAQSQPEDIVLPSRGEATEEALGQAQEARHVPDTFENTSNVFAADVDSDGDVDVLAAAGHADKITWWENSAPDAFLWTELASSTPIGLVSMSGMVYDKSRDRLVVFQSQETWEYDGANWQQIPTSQSPPALYQYAMAYDEARQRVVLFGEANEAGLGRDDTWEYNGSDWVQIVTSHAPSPRREIQYGMAYDSNRQRMVLFGGCYRGNPSICYNDTWEYDGIDWEQINTPNTPTIRGNHALIYDVARNKMVLFSGQSNPSSGIVINDMWEYDGNTWTQITPSTLPPGRGWHMMIYDTNQNKTLLFGGMAQASVILNDTWEFDGADWQQLSLDISPLAGCRRSRFIPYMWGSDAEEKHHMWGFWLVLRQTASKDEWNDGLRRDQVNCNVARGSDPFLCLC